MLVPKDPDRYTFKQRLAKIQVDLRENARFHLNEAQRLTWIYFFVGFLPVVFLSGTISVFASGWYPWEFTVSGKDNLITGLGIVNAGLFAMMAYWNWQGHSEKHSISSKAFEHLLSKVAAVSVECQLYPDKIRQKELEYLNKIYEEIGRCYEEAPRFPRITAKRLKKRVRKEREKELQRIEEEEKMMQTSPDKRQPLVERSSLPEDEEEEEEQKRSTPFVSGKSFIGD